jgi:hypothetical protein
LYPYFKLIIGKRIFNILSLFFSLIDIIFGKLVLAYYSIFYYYQIKDFFFHVFYFDNSTGYLRHMDKQKMLYAFDFYDFFGDSEYSTNVKRRILRTVYGKTYYYIRWIP